MLLRCPSVLCEAFEVMESQETNLKEFSTSGNTKESGLNSREGIVPASIMGETHEENNEKLFFFKEKM